MDRFERPFFSCHNESKRFVLLSNRSFTDCIKQHLIWCSSPSFRLFAFRTWFLERNNFTYGSHRNDLNVVGHYTQMIWAASHKVGCGLAKCARGGPRNKPFFNYVCNYCPMWVNFSIIKCQPNAKSRSLNKNLLQRCDEISRSYLHRSRSFSSAVIGCVFAKFQTIWFCFLLQRQSDWTTRNAV